MSTNNFAFENILIAIDDSEADLFEELTLPSIQEDLQNVFKDGYEISEYINDRSYGGRYVFAVPVYTKGSELYKKIKVYYRGGYYSGANIDYIVGECELYDEVETLETLDAKVERYCKSIEKILRTYGTELLKVAQFSNGEAVYKVKK